MRSIALAACLLLAACGSNDNKSSFPGSGSQVGSAQPVGASPAAPSPSTVFALSIYSGDNQIASVGSAVADPLVVEVRDANGSLCDGIYVKFEAEIPGDVLDLGTATSGDGYYLVTPHGSARAGVGAEPAAPGSHRVRARVLPTPAGIATPQNSSNDVFFTVIGQ